MSKILQYDLLFGRGMTFKVGEEVVTLYLGGKETIKIKLADLTPIECLLLRYLGSVAENGEGVRLKKSNEGMN